MPTIGLLPETIFKILAYSLALNCSWRPCLFQSPYTLCFPRHVSAHSPSLVLFFTLGDMSGTRSLSVRFRGQIQSIPYPYMVLRISTDCFLISSVAWTYTLRVVSSLLCPSLLWISLLDTPPLPAPSHACGEGCENQMLGIQAPDESP